MLCIVGNGFKIVYLHIFQKIINIDSFRSFGGLTVSKDICRTLLYQFPIVVKEVVALFPKYLRFTEVVSWSKEFFLVCRFLRLIHFLVMPHSVFCMGYDNRLHFTINTSFNSGRFNSHVFSP